MTIKRIAVLVSATMLMFASSGAMAQDKNCYAKAMPAKGNMGGHHWAPNLQMARNGAIDACRKYNNYPVSENSKTCKVVEQYCKKK